MKKIITVAIFAVIALAVSKVHASGNAKAVTNSKAATSTDVRDKNGKLVYSVKRYDESQLNREIKTIVHSQYADFDIAGVEEVVMPGTDKSVYIIHLQNDTQIKIVRVYNGEAEVTANYKKG